MPRHITQRPEEGRGPLPIWSPNRPRRSPLLWSWQLRGKKVPPAPAGPGDRGGKDLQDHSSREQRRRRPRTVAPAGRLCGGREQCGEALMTWVGGGAQHTCFLRTFPVCRAEPNALWEPGGDCAEGFPATAVSSVLGWGCGPRLLATSPTWGAKWAPLGRCQISLRNPVVRAVSSFQDPRMLNSFQLVSHQ